MTANVSGALPAAPPTPPAPGQQNRRCAVPSPPFPRFRSVGIRHPAFPDLRPGLLGPSLGLAPSGPPQAAFKSAPGAFVHAGMTWLVNSGSAILMPDPTPQLSDFYVLQDGFCRCEITPPIHAFLFIFPYSSRHFSHIKKPESTAGGVGPHRPRRGVRGRPGQAAGMRLEGEKGRKPYLARPGAGRGKPRGPRSGEGDRGSRGCWGRGGERPQPGRVRR